MSAGNLILAGTFEGKTSCEELIESYADCIDIGACIELFAQDLFRSHVGQRAQNHPRSCELVPKRRKSEPEVQQFDAVVLADHDVGRLYIAMNDSLFMRVGQA